MLNYDPVSEKMFFDDLEKLSLEEQNEKLKVELKSMICENEELLRNVMHLHSQISKYRGDYQ